MNMYYFSYGSNMSVLRLRSRVPAASVVGVGKITSHRLMFHKVCKVGSGKCDAYHTNEPDHYIIGVLFIIDPSEKPILDKAEGLGFGYEEKMVSVEIGDGRIISALTYYATNIDSSVKPFHWYKEHVLRGARENGLPNWYIDMSRR
mgnify:CR=1 FL=1